jgi:hypothetical protein
VMFKAAEPLGPESPSYLKGGMGVRCWLLVVSYW